MLASREHLLQTTKYACISIGMMVVYSFMVLVTQVTISGARETPHSYSAA